MIVIKSSSAYTVTRWSLAIYFKLWWRLEGTTPAFEPPRLEVIYHSPFFLALIVRSHCLMRDIIFHSANSPFGVLYFVWGLNDSTFGLRPSVATFPFHLSSNLCHSPRWIRTTKQATSPWMLRYRNQSLSGSEPGLSEHRIYNIVISWIYCLTKIFNCSGSTSPSAATGYRPKRDYYSTGEADTYLNRYKMRDSR